jgi:hypothetical protein
MDRRTLTQALDRRPQSLRSGENSKDAPGRISVCLAASLLITALGSGGCASAVWHPRVESVSGQYQNTTAVTAKAEAIAEGEADEVKAFVAQLPPGITIQDGVLKADPEAYEVLGQVTAKPAGEFFYPYRESWRKPVCYPQRVLTIATLYMWFLVPSVWPCFISPGTVEERRDAIVEAMKRATKAMGGNMVLVTGFGGTTSIVATSKTSASVSTMEATEGVGWAIRVRRTPTPPGSTTPQGVRTTTL